MTAIMTLIAADGVGESFIKVDVTFEAKNVFLPHINIVFRGTL